MRSYEISRVNTDALRDVKGLVRRSEEDLTRQISSAAGRIIAAGEGARIVLLAGPSGSGKTTAAHALAHALRARGGSGRVLSMDDYFLPHSAGPLPVDERGEIDLESPDRLDRRLLQEHLSQLQSGHCVAMPVFDFSCQERSPRTVAFRLQDGESAIAEGIHALNPAVSGGLGLGIFADADISFRAPDGRILTSQMVRLMRRILRDRLFRGRAPEETLALFPSVSRGEQRYILPHRGRAALSIGTGMAYELGLYRTLLLPILPEGGPNAELAANLRHFLQAALPIDPCLVPRRSFLREFIGAAGL